MREQLLQQARRQPAGRSRRLGAQAGAPSRPVLARRAGLAVRRHLHRRLAERRVLPQLGANEAIGALPQDMCRR
jgi:hypothetical protein